MAFLPNYRYTPAVTEALAELERLREAMARLAPDPPRLADLRRAAVVRRSVGALALDGLAIRPDEAHTALTPQPPSFEGKGESDSPLLPGEGAGVRAAVRGYALALDQIAGDWPAERDPAALPVLAGLHFFLIHTPEQRGPLPGLRRTPAALADARSGAPLAFAPPPASLRPALQDLVNWLGAARSAVAPALRAGVAHWRLMRLQPQETANARTACAYTALLLHRADLLPHSLPAPEAAFATDLDRYYAALLTPGDDPLTDAPLLTPWLEYFLAALRDELRQAHGALLAVVSRQSPVDGGSGVGSRGSDDELRIADRGLRNDDVALEADENTQHATRNTPVRPPEAAPLRLNPRQRHILDLLAAPGATLANNECQQLFGVSPVTAARDLRELVDLGLIRMWGQGRSTYYARAASPPANPPPGTPAAKPDVL